MPNIILTNHCNLRCSYCFAGQPRVNASSVDKSELSLPSLQRIIEFLLANKVKTFRMIGGEPTLHSKFAEILRIARTSFDKVGIYTNGLWNKQVQEIIADSDRDSLQFLINVNEKKSYTINQWENFLATLEILRGSPSVVLGINIYHSDYDLDLPLKLASEYGFSAIRYSIARPIAGLSGNSYIPFKDFATTNLSQRIFQFITEAFQQDITCYHDCVLPQCFFSNQELGTLSKMGLWYSFSCNAALDIHPDMTVSRCFGLSKFLRAPLENFQTLDELNRFFKVRLAPVTAKYEALAECGDCVYRQKNLCQGGCYSELLQTNEVAGSTNSAWPGQYCSSIDLPDPLFETLLPELSLTTRLVIEKTGKNKSERVLKLSNSELNESVSIGRSFPLLLSFVDGQKTVAEITELFLARNSLGNRKQTVNALRELFVSGMLQQAKGPFFSRKN